MGGSTIAFLILAPTTAILTFLFWNAAAAHGRGIRDEREALALVAIAAAFVVAVGLLALLA